MKPISELLYDIAYKHKRIMRLAFVLITLSLTLFLYNRDSFERLELLTVDYRFKLRPASIKPSDVVFIDMAEDSIEKIGRWPWTRKWHSTLIAVLSAYGPKAIFFDVLFVEPQDPESDLALEQALKNSGRVYLPVMYDMSEQKAQDRSGGQGIVSILKPLEIFRKPAKGIGHINVPPDNDGILRRVPPLIRFGRDITYHMGLKIASDTLGVPEHNIVFYPKKHVIVLQRPESRDIEIPLDKNNQIIINWREKWAHLFTHYSYIDVIHSYAAIKEGKSPKIDLGVFKDKICVVGLTATALTDIKPTPLEMAYPAVGINALMIYSVLSNDFVREAGAKADILAIIFVCVAATIMLFNARSVNEIVLALISIFLYSLFSLGLFIVSGILITTFYPVFAIAVSYGLIASYTQLINAVEKTNLFKQAMMDELTRCYNIRHFNYLLEVRLNQSAKYKGERFSVVMIDIDNFKNINDTYGHQAGDRVLQEFAAAINSKCRKADIVARYGGEEFIVLMSGAGAREAAEVAEKIRLAADQKKIAHAGDEIHTTLSLGVAQYSDERTKEELIGKADKALYRAKREGKNRVCSY